MSVGYLTVEQLLNKLERIRNKRACVVLCELDREYSPFSRVFDKTRSKPTKDGDLGVVCLALHSDEGARAKMKTGRKKRG
jgi:hypothetical protein